MGEAKLELVRLEQISMLETQQAKLEDSFNEILRSHIINVHHADQLHQWLDVDGSDGDFDVLYRASRDGFSANAFHSKCDNMGPTLTLIHTMDGHVVGGYSNTPWSRNDKYEKASKAFIFALSSPSLHHGPVRMVLKNQNDSHAVRHHPSRGPIFGSGWQDLYINKDMKRMRSYLGRSYQNNSSWPLKSGKFYNIKEIEVYRVSSP